MKRSGGRRADQLRPIKITRGFTKFAPGSVLVETGDTRVLCTASFEQGVPRWKEGKGGGWVTAEYDMLPGSTGSRRGRNRGRVDGRTQEIQRLIGRSLRAVMDLEALGENTIILDCDVLQADGGTRTASITGAYVALCDAVRFGRQQGWVAGEPIREAIAAVSVGCVGGRVLLDLDYREDVAADVDFNVAMTSAGCYVELQGTGESATFTRDDLDRMLKMAGRGIKRLLAAQQDALAGRKPKRR